jgi:uncharacterized protein
MKTPSQKIIVIYHGGCRDGFGGAWAAWRKFGDRAAYLPVFDRFAPPCVLKNKEIYLIDYGYPMEVTRKLIRDNARVTAVDHHITAKDTVVLTKDYSFSLHHSGAVLAWNYFHPKQKVPTLLRCVEDFDLWRWNTPSSKEILAVVNLFGQEFATWNRIAKDLESAAKRKIYTEKGKVILHYEEWLLHELLPSAELVNFLGHKVFVINAPRHFTDDLGNMLAKKSHSFAVVWSEYAGEIRVSLRSDGSVDVAKIAQKFNGGGHKTASGFSLPADKKLPWKLAKR